MQFIAFDLKTILVSFLFFFSTCHLSTPTTVSAVNDRSSIMLPEPKNESQNDYKDVATKLTLILLEENRLFSYEGTDVNKGRFYEAGEARKMIRQAKSRYPGKDFVIFIKPAKKTSYKATVDILDEMVVNQIGHYSINELLPEEKKKLGIKNSNE